MTEYPKINGVFKRDDRGAFVMGEWACEEFGYLQDQPWQWTEKVDGTNIRLHYSADDPTFRGNEHAFVAGRTDNAQIPPTLLNRLVEILRAAPLEQVFPDHHVVLYGEGYGAKIQKGGGNYLHDRCDFVLFDVKVGDWWLRRADVEDIAARLGLDVVQVVSTCTLNDAIEIVRDVGFKSAWPGVTQPEGLVGRPAVDLWNRKGERITTKVKHKDFRTSASRVAS